MRRTALLARVALGALLLPAAATAQDRPVLAPTRDVAVTYLFTGQTEATSPAKTRVTYADGNQRVRLDLFAYPQATVPFSSLIFDAPDNRIYTLLPAQGAYYVLPATGRKNPGLLLTDAMDYTRAGEATIAGYRCTDWTVTRQGTPEGTACVTDDGVLLRATRVKSPGTMQANQVVYSTPPASLFAPGPELKLKPNTLPARPAPPPAK